jgi:hypothetical protein
MKPTETPDGSTAAQSAGKRKIGIVFMILGGGQLILTLITGRMDGLDGLSNIVTGQYGVPATFANKPMVFLAGLALYGTLFVYGYRLRKNGERGAP